MADAATVSAQGGIPGSRRRLSTWVKLVYGSGDLGMATYGTLRQFFYAIFLTDVVGLDPRLASVAAVIGVVWDAINDPLVGRLSDGTRTRFGRRRPFLALFAIPYALGFLLLWWAPPWESQLLRMVGVTLAFMMSDTLQTLVVVPYMTLTAEMTDDYDERTELTGYRMVFNLLASLATAVAAPMIVNGMVKAGGTAQQAYVLVASIFGAASALPFLVIAALVREAPDRAAAEGPLPIRDVLQAVWTNVPFRFATGLYVLNWIAVDLVALMIPYLLLYWVGRGDLLATVLVLGDEIAIQSVVLGLMMVTAMVSVPLWTWLSGRVGKRRAYVIGMGFWALIQAAILLVRPGQMSFLIVLAVLSGLCVSTAHVLPEAIFPDVIDWDELRTRKRQEGVFYGAKNFLRKLTGAVAIFLGLPTSHHRPVPVCLSRPTRR
jgi:glycoside/pentoside/hexuronide:cation symporter, GPH family